MKSINGHNNPHTMLFKPATMIATSVILTTTPCSSQLILASNNDEVIIIKQ
jgi:hypothetical protein